MDMAVVEVDSETGIEEVGDVAAEVEMTGMIGVEMEEDEEGEEDVSIFRGSSIGIEEEEIGIEEIDGIEIEAVEEIEAEISVSIEETLIGMVEAVEEAVMIGEAEEENVAVLISILAVEVVLAEEAIGIEVEMAGIEEEEDEIDGIVIVDGDVEVMTDGIEEVLEAD
jgi:hypothetical protein